MFIPISQVAYGQNIIDQIGQAFNNLTSGMMGGNQSNQSSTNGSSSNNSGASSSGNNSGATGGNASGGAGNQSAGEQDIGSIQQLQNLTSGNQELLTNNTSVAPENASLSQGLEKEQYVEPENQSNALANSSSGSNSSQ